jgi:Leucine-rich repeat (LRR) protein
MNRFLLLFSCLLLLVGAKGQNKNAEIMIKQGDSAFIKGEYKTAINKYFAAEAFDLSIKDFVKEKINKVFDKIQALRAEADKSKREVQASLNKANKLISAFYFYEDKIALTLGGDKYEKKFYFIDKNGDKIERLDEWDKADPFEETGYAKVEKENKTYLLDTLGNTYPVAYNIENLSKEITALDLSAKQWDKFPAEVLENTQLKILILTGFFSQGNNFKNLPEEIGKLQNLEYLDLSYCHLAEFSSEICTLKNLTTLNLGGNQLDSLPPEIKNLKNLNTLILYVNQLNSLPPEIGELSNLKYLELNDNELKNLPKEIIKLRKLINLGVTENHLSNLPSQIGSLQNLTILSISENELENLPDEIGNLKNLKTLELGYNPFRSLPTTTSRLQNLTTLDISFITTFNSFPIQISQLKNLKELNLGSSELSVLPDIVYELTNLITLDLSDNQLAKLPTQISKLKNLKHLSLLRNPITKTEQEKIRKLLPGCEIHF